MKKHLTMIVGGYYPFPSPTGKCAEQYVSLLKDEYEIDVVCIANINDNIFIHDDKKVFPVTCRYVSFQKQIENKLCLLYLGSKVLLRIWNSLHQPNNLHWYVKAAYKKLESIHSKKPIDIIFSVGAPMASHCAALHFKSKHPDVRWVTYSVDSYAAQNKNGVRFVNFEKKVLCKSDYNLLSEEIFFSSPFLYDKFANHVSTLPYLLPVMKQDVCSNRYFSKSKVNFVYAGSFYKKIRNPSFLLKTFMHTKEDAVLHLFCTSDCDEQIDKAVSMSGGKIVRHATVGPDEIAYIYAEADVLVSLGNSVPEFKPSKTFEYIATCKPILNIYYKGYLDDVLEKYPINLQICNSADVILSAKEIDKFILNSVGKSISENEVKTIFKKNMPDNIHKIMVRAFTGEVS